MADPIVFRGFTQERASALAQFHLAHGATSAKVVPDGNLFDVEVVYRNDPGTGATDGQILRGDGSFSFTAEVVGNDIVVQDVSATWFGGLDDPSDNGLTASGVSTRDHPTLQGCALPLDGANSSRTSGSPIPKVPWQTQVRVKNLHTGTEITVPLIDLGPSKTAPSHAAIDLTKPAFVALGGNPAAGKMQVDYTILGGAKFVRSAGTV
jgi:hypothetical protein